MAKDTNIFSSVYNDTELLTVSGAIFRWSGHSATENETNVTSNAGIPLYLTSFNATYGRSIIPQYPINVAENGASKQLLLAGMASGSGNMQGIVAPNAEALADFLNAIGKACAAGIEDTVTMTIIPFGNACESSNMTITLQGVVAGSHSFSIQGGQGGFASCSDLIQISFTNMKIS